MLPEPVRPCSVGPNSRSIPIDARGESDDRVGAPGCPGWVPLWRCAKRSYVTWPRNTQKRNVLNRAKRRRRDMLANCPQWCTARFPLLFFTPPSMFTLDACILRLESLLASRLEPQTCARLPVSLALYPAIRYQCAVLSRPDRRGASAIRLVLAEHEATGGPQPGFVHSRTEGGNICTRYHALELVRLPLDLA